MTYFEFHLVFLAPPLAILAWRFARASMAGRRRALGHVGALSLIALVYTTPWDNYLVRRAIWWYGPDRVLGTIGFVPVEEYLFFLLQPILLGLLYLELERGAVPAPGPYRGARRAGGLFWLGATGAGILLLRTEPGTYLGLILVWAGPVLAGQWAWAGRVFLAWRRPMAVTVVAASLYLWVADRLAIGLGIWDISAELTTGVHILGLPVEEAVFFLLTNILVIQGLILFRRPPPLPAAARRHS